MTTAISINKGQDKMIAACIIEQETEIIKSFPGEIYATKQRIINGIPWTVKASFNGEKLQTCFFEVYKKNKIIDKAILYVYNKK